ncbi:S-layer homology domain-containing protein [Paenibacillus sp. 1_12]|uniref:S-layer homology domain-containing protein n=1 Tax=Paenibacillus sp. 1_12 TaxID=1566278 RepID=UPI0008E5E386|nr:S-layer homology domain-containing protein [Paenibacillus sp. 1_12]SFL16528.1 S-layer homology domain-containing protein [Paenibacillus sp. 1_12]
MEKLSGVAADTVIANATKKGITTLAGAVDFTITAEANGKTISVNDFGNVYVPRSFEISNSVDTNKAAGVLYNPDTGTMTFVPTLFSKNGSSLIVTIKRPGNSIYTVVQADKTFADLSGHWAQADIEQLASKLLINGSTDTTFVPQNSITRAEFAALLVRAASLIEGLDNGKFQPNVTITREQMTVMIARAIQLACKKSDTDTKKLAAFDDSSAISAWAKDAAAGALNAGIVKGTTDRTFSPDSKATRAEAAVMLKRFLVFAEFMN